MIFLRRSPVPASAPPRRATAGFPAPLPPGSAAWVRLHQVAAHTACAIHRAARRAAPDPWLRSSPCDPRAASVPRRGVCRSHHTCAGALPRTRSGLSVSCGSFLLPKPADAASARCLVASCGKPWGSCPRKRPNSARFMRWSGVH